LTPQIADLFEKQSLNRMDGFFRPSRHSNDAEKRRIIFGFPTYFAKVGEKSPAKASPGANTGRIWPDEILRLTFLSFKCWLQ
jgi:hypothetical protein